jgi:peptidoglycan/LPS O-acetylase OafA/YrhL
MTTRKNIEMLTGLRGFAVVIVFVSHLSSTGLITPLLSNGYGQIGVMIFFLLSGFLMSHLYIETSCDKVSLVRYIKYIAARVFPLFLLIVVGSYLISFIVDDFYYKFRSLEEFYKAVLFLSAKRELWAIPVEVQFYAVFIIVWYFYQKGVGFISLVALSSITVLPTIVYYLHFGRIPGNALSTYSFALFGGVFLGILWNGRFQDMAYRLKPALDVIGIFFLLGVAFNLPQLRLEHGFVISEEKFG